MTGKDEVLYKQNIAALKKHHPRVFDQIINRRDAQPGNIELVRAENNKFNIKVDLPEKKGLFIHDHDDPGSESRAFLSLVDEGSTGVVMMFGLGLGYSIRELLEKRKKLQYLVVFELNIDFFTLALHHIDLVDILSDKRLILCLDAQADLSTLLSPANRALMLENVHTLKLMSCVQSDQNYEELLSRVFDYVNTFNTEGATKIIHGRSFVENRLKHLTSMHHDHKLEDLAGKFEGIPALIVAAGPSLDKNIDQIADTKGKALIISVDTALPSLLKHNVVPDFVTSIDYKELTYEKISGAAANPDCRKINLICTSWVTDRVPKIFPAKTVFWAYSKNALEDWINVILGGKMAIAGAGTVAHLNLISAKVMGCDPVIFVGQDLAFSDSKGHAGNVALSNDKKVKNMLDAEQDIIWVEGIGGQRVPTNRQLYNYKNLFEKMIQASGGRTVNSTEGGAVITGAQDMPLTKAIEKYCTSEIHPDDIKFHQNTDPISAIASVLETIKNLEKLLKKIKKTSGPIKKQLGKMKKGVRNYKGFSSLPQKLQKQISDYDIVQKKADENSIWPIFDELTMEGLKYDQREKNEIEKIEGKLDKYLDWMIKSITRIEKINTIRMDNLEWFKNQLNELFDYYNEEKLYLTRLKEGTRSHDAVKKLAGLYFQTDNYALLEKIPHNWVVDVDGDELLDLQYYKVIVKLYRGEYAKAEEEIAAVTKKDPSYTDIINAKRKELGDYYWSLSNSKNNTITNRRNDIVESILLKGLKCCPGHDAIKNTFRKYAENDIKQIRQIFESGGNAESKFYKKMVEKWVKYINVEKMISDCLDTGTRGLFLLYHGKIMVGKGNFASALANFQKVLDMMPDSPDIHISIADSFFSMQDYDSGLMCLKKAVDLDKKFAVYWLNMGRNLQQKGDYDGAILAFEQYFMVSPENFIVLKEIGDCHVKLGNLESAKEAYQHLKSLE